MLPEQSRRIHWYLLLGLLLLNALVALLATGSMQESQRDHAQRAALDAESIALAIDATLGHNLDQINGSLEILSSRYHQLAMHQHLNPQSWQEVLAQEKSRLPPGVTFHSTDADGKFVEAVAEHPPEPGLPPWQTALLESAGKPPLTPIYLPAQTQGQAPMIGIARQLQGADGRFSGVIYGVLPLTVVSERFARMAAPYGTRLDLFDARLQRIEHWPQATDLPAAEDQTVPAALRSALAINPEGGRYRHALPAEPETARVHAYRYHTRYAFVVDVGVPERPVLAGWQGEVNQTFALLLLFMLSSGLLALVMHRHWQGQQGSLATVSESEQRFRSLFSHMAEGMVLHELISDADGTPRDYRLIDANPAFEKHTGLSRQTTLGQLASALYGVTPPPHLEIYAKVVKSGEGIDFETYFAPLRRHFRVRAYRAEAGRFVTIFEDTSARKREETQTALLATVFSSSREAILICNAENRIVAVNRAFSELTGYSSEEACGKDPGFLSAGNTPPEVYARMWSQLMTIGAWEGELWDRRKDGETYPKRLSLAVVRDSDGEVANFIGNFVDIAEKKASEARINHLAHHDPLTNLPNRFNLQERLDQAISLARRNLGMLAVMLIDLDRFKAINDTLGHHAGDLLLIEVARRLKETVRDSDILARLGGDEFVVALTQISSPSDAAHGAEKLVHALSAPYEIEGNTLRTSPSIGVCLYPNDAGDSGELLKKADVAMYHAKSRGRCNYQFFTEEMQRVALERLTLEAELRQAVALGQLRLHYQPQLELASNRLVSIEALLRWEHPQRGMVPPMQFIPIAEETGLIREIGDWVLSEACRQLAQWRSAGLGDLTVGVNLSPLQFQDPALPERIARHLDDAGLPASALELEVTESVSMASPEESIALMQELRDKGMSLSIDDFGTGYSSLAYLKRFPIVTLKIDRSFVKDIEIDINDAEICDVTVLLAHKLGLEVVAEGVETEAQLKYLTSIGCERIQGYLISRPLPAAELAPLVTRWNAGSSETTIELWP